MSAPLTFPHSFITPVYNSPCCILCILLWLTCIKVCIIGGVTSVTDRWMVTQKAVAVSCLLAFTWTGPWIVFVLLEPFGAFWWHYMTNNMTAARLLYIRRWSSGFTEWMDFEWQVCVWSWWPQASFPFTVFLFVSICEIEKLKASCEAFPVSWCVHELTDIVLLLFLRVKLRVLARTKSDSASTIFAVLLRNRRLHKASANTS